MQILYLNSQNEERIHNELVQNKGFYEIDPNSDIKDQILKNQDDKSLFWLDWSAKNKSDLNLDVLEVLGDGLKIFIVFSDKDSGVKPTPIKPDKKDPAGIPWIPVQDNMPPYPDLDIMKITIALKLPWNSIYTEYFWTAISQNGVVNLFDNKRYKLTNADVVVFLLTSRYFSKVTNVFKFPPDEEKRISTLGKSLTLLLHGASGAVKINVDEFVQSFNISSVFNLDTIKSYISDQTGRMTIILNKMELLINDISYFLKALNFDYWIKAITARKLLEKNEAAFVAKFSKVEYLDLYRTFSNLEHSTDYVLSSLFELTKEVKIKIDQGLEKIKTNFPN